MRDLHFHYFAVVLLAACGGTEGTPITPSDASVTDATTADASASDASADAPSEAAPADAGRDGSFCERAQERTVRCEGGTFDLQRCLDQQRCLQTVWKPGVGDQIGECLITRACNSSDDPCFANPNLPYADAGAYPAYRQACLQRRQDCIAQDAGSFSNDNCGVSLAGAKDEVLATANACLGLACPQIRDCFEAIGEDAGCR
jgi:hypothetical protein